MPRLRVGLIGLGEVAQLMHLPVLHRLQDRFAVTALHDAAPEVLARVADRWGVAGRHSSVESLVGDERVDAVFVLSPDQYHFAHGMAALSAGKHLFVEKPACLLGADVARLADAAAASRRVAMVGYMRRFAPAFLEAKARLGSLGPLSYARFTDFFCEGPWFFRQTSDVVHPERRSSGGAPGPSRALREEMMRAACGDGASPALLMAYEYLTGVASHSISAMRDLLGGPPRKVAGARMSPRGDQLTALFDYGDFGVVYEYLIDDVARFDAGIEVFSRTRRLRLAYDTPYVRNLPMRLEIQESSDGGNALTVLGPYYKDPFEAELEAFHRAVTAGGENRTPLSDSLADFAIFEAIIGCLKGAP